MVVEGNKPKAAINLARFRHLKTAGAVQDVSRSSRDRAMGYLWI